MSRRLEIGYFVVLGYWEHLVYTQDTYYLSGWINLHRLLHD